MPRARLPLFTGIALPGLALAGCATAPAYQPPETPIAAAFKQVDGWVPAAAEARPAQQWWQVFDDPALSALMPRVAADNPDLASAVARYEQALAAVGQARAPLFPQIDAGADLSRERLSAGRPLASSSALYTERQVGASLSYELDLFGRIRNQLRDARARAAASDADVAALRLGLEAQLAGTYFDMRALDARLELLGETVTAFQRAYQLTETRHGGGIASGLDVSRAATVLANARAELDTVAAARARNEHAIAILIGENPAAFSIPSARQDVLPPIIPVGLPSTLLRDRPDVIAAERRVAAANARIGAARAALFPQVTLGAAGGFQAVRGDILGASSTFWALGPLSALASVFDGGARRAAIRDARAQFDEASATYRATVLNAFREVEDDLATGRHLASRSVNLLAAARAAERTRELALTRYRDGASDYLDVVTAQTAALDAQRALILNRSEQMRIAVDLVRALGGLYPATAPAG